MSTFTERAAEALNIIDSNPGIEPGQLSARCTLSSSKNLGPLLKDMLKQGAIIRTGLGDASGYHLTDYGHKSLPGLAHDSLADADPAGADEIPSTTEEVAAVFEELPTITAGAGEVVLEQESEPLPVIDSDRTSLDEALIQLSELVAESPRPVNLSDLIEFNRRGADLIRHQAPVPAALMESTANALERAYSQ